MADQFSTVASPSGSRPRRRRWWPWVLVGAVVIAGIAIGTNSRSGTVSDTAPTGTNSGRSAEVGATGGTPVPGGNPRFGQTWTSDDGLSVTIGRPKPFTPSKYALGPDDSASDHLAFTVTVVNGTAKNFDPMMVSIHLQSGNTEAEQIFDSENKIGDLPSTTLLPGREVKWTVGFSVGNPKDLVMEVSPELFSSSVIFTS